MREFNESTGMAENADILGIAVLLGDHEIIKNCLDDKAIQKRYSEETLKEAEEYLKTLSGR